eukprot:COSAG01_NODE_11329_length_1956_cov_2.707054_2_plen_51_part_00
MIVRCMSRDNTGAGARCNDAANGCVDVVLSVCLAAVVAADDMAVSLSGNP